MDRPGRGMHAAFGAVALVSALAAVGCRAILGVHDFDDPIASDAELPDSDAAVDSGVDTGVGPDGCHLDEDPRDPTILSNALQVVTGDSFSCALLSNNKVVCWGSNDAGQLDQVPAKLPFSDKPIEIELTASDSPPASVTAGDQHVCVRRGLSNDVVCWGDNSHRQSAPGNSTSPATPAPILAAETMGDPRAGSDHTCAVAPDAGGKVYCWGDTRFLQLGNASDSGGPQFVNNPTQLKTTIEVAVGNAHACALLADAGAVCWGDGRDDQLGIGYFDGGTLFRPAFSGLALSSVRAGGNDTCVKTETGFVCVGANADGQIERADSSLVASPSSYDLLDDAADLALANHHSCAWTADGRLYCFGDDTLGELGDNGAGGGPVVGPDGGTTFGPVIWVSTWSNPPGVSDGQRATVQRAHTCAIIGHTCGNDGTVYCWGSNGSGQLGNGTAGGTSMTPVAVVAP